MGVSAQAQVSAPSLPAAQQLKLDGTDTVYLYNVKAQKFLTDGGDWGTKAVFRNTGIKVAIVPNNNGTYQLRTYGQVAKKSWYNLFVGTFNAEDGGTAWTDGSGKQAYEQSFVIYPATGGNSFEISVDTIADHKASTSLENPAQTRMGWKSDEDLSGTQGSYDEARPVLRPTLNMSDADYASYGVEWQGISPASMETYNYRVSTLMDAINSAVESGVDVSAQIAVYNNENATLAELQAAYTQVNAAVRNAAMASATIDNPVDITQYVTSANCQSLTGWTTEGTFDDNGNVGSGGNGTKWQVHTATYTATDGTEITKFIERWVNQNSDKETNTSVSKAGKLSDSKIYQTLEGLPAGGYEVSVYVNATHQGRQDEGILDNSGVHLFINETSSQVYTMSGVPQKKTTIAVVGEDGKLTFGIETKNTICNWLFMANFEVKYYGNDAKAVLLMDAQSTAQNYESTYSATDCNETYLNALDEAIAAVNALTNSSTEAEIRAAKQTLEDAKDALLANVAAYESLEELYSTVQDFMNTADASVYETEDLSTFLEDGDGETFTSGYDTVADDYTLTTEQLQAYMAKITELYNAAKKSGIKAGRDVTSDLLSDPSFENNGTGWQGKQVVSSTYQNCEAYESTFDMYQELTEIPNGVYTITAQAFQRVAYNDVASALHSEGEEAENITTYLYGNDIARRVSSPYVGAMTEASGGSPADYEYQGMYIPNSMQGFMAATEQGLYKNTVSVLVTDGNLRLGIKCETARQSGYWSIWDNFTLTYEGTDAAAYAKVVDPIIADANALTSQKMSADVLAKLQNAITAAQGTSDKDIIIALNNAVTEARASVAKYLTLKEAIADIEERKANQEAQSAEAEAAYSTALATAQGIYENGTVADDGVAGAIYDLKKAFTAYLMYDAKSATPESPVDVTKVLSNADFATNTASGWTIEKGSSGFQDNLYEMEFYNNVFNVYQEIPGMPAGRYELQVQGFHRQGSTAAMRDSVAAGTLEEGAVIYINDATTPLTSLSEYANASYSGLSDYVEYDATAGTYVPNTMTTALEVFNATTDKVAKLSLYVAEDTDFKVGAKKEKNLSMDWTIFNYFKLLYLGNGATGIESVKGNAAGQLGTQVYNVNGVATGKLQKGLNIVRTTLSDGTVKVSKVIVK